MKRLNIHVFMHVPYEGLGCIEQWTIENNHTVSYTQFYNPFQLPNPDNFDWLIVMGGPMGVYDENIYPWLVAEKSFIHEMIEKGKTVIGICLGSQLIAEVLGSKVYPNVQKEIGWFDLSVSESGKNLPVLSNFESHFPVFHWHGDTFDLPHECTILFESKATKNQGFLYNEKVLGLQFHFEVTEKSLNEMLESGQNELVENETIQTRNQILEKKNLISENNRKMYQLLDFLAR